MITEVLDLTGDRDKAIERAGELLAEGKLVAIPTETVYGLAADAFNPVAVKNIFVAKGRPQDNPLIVHICSTDQLDDIVSCVPPKAKLLMELFWPGPLTLVMPKGDKIPDDVSAGLDTVAVRFPLNKDAQDIIRASGTALAAPSANISGKPSPTRAEHVINDLNGRIDAIASSGSSNVGVESTVVDVTGDIPVLLRPGGVTPEMLREAVGEIKISNGVLSQLGDGEQARSPGMKYKHYSPSNNVVLIKGTYEQFRDYLNSLPENSCTAMCSKSEGSDINQQILFCGENSSGEEYARELFDALRRIDGKDTGTVYARAPEQTGIGLAVYNRLIRAAGFEVISLEE